MRCAAWRRKVHVQAVRWRTSQSKFGHSRPSDARPCVCIQRVSAARVGRAFDGGKRRFGNSNWHRADLRTEQGDGYVGCAKCTESIAAAWSSYSAGNGCGVGVYAAGAKGCGPRSHGSDSLRLAQSVKERAEPGGTGHCDPDARRARYCELDIELAAKPNPLPDRQSARDYA